MNNSSFINTVQSFFIGTLLGSTAHLLAYLVRVEAGLPEIVLQISVNTITLACVYILIMGSRLRFLSLATGTMIGAYLLILLNRSEYIFEKEYNLITVTGLSVMVFCGVVLIAYKITGKNPVSDDGVFPTIDMSFYEYLKEYYDNVESIEYEDSRAIKFEMGLKRLVEQFRKDENEGVFVEIYRISKPNLRMSEIANHLKTYLDMSGEIYTQCVQSNNLAQRIEKYNVRGCFFGTRSSVTANSNGVFYCKHSGIVVIFSAPVDYQNQPMIEN